MSTERKALYNSLRMNWIMNPNMPVEPWQVEDYRNISLDEIFDRLKLQEIELDKINFLALADEYDTPESLLDHLLEEEDLDQRSHDQIYLLIFELWRRLVPEKPTLTIFCDELDYQIQQYDHGEAKDLEAIQDALANLKVVLDENVDQGGEPGEVFEQICSGCANDIESFLYDYISEQIDEHNYSYSSDLLDAFEDYVQDIKWFEFLRLRQVSATDPEGANNLLRGVLLDNAKHPDLVYSLEILSFLVQGGDEKVFTTLLKQTVSLLETEEDFQDLLAICIDFYHLLDLDSVENQIQQIAKSCSKIPLERQIERDDPRFAQLFKAIGH